MERVLDDAADKLLREVGELRSEGRGKGVEVVALVLSDAARRDPFPDVRVVRFCGEGGAGAEEDRERRRPGDKQRARSRGVRPWGVRASTAAPFLMSSITTGSA